MKTIKIIAVALSCFGALLAQEGVVDFNHLKGLKMETQYSTKDSELGDVLSFEGIDYMKLKFSGDSLIGKSYHLTIKEIWDGIVVRDTTVINSRTIGIKQFETLNDSIFNMTIISKLDEDNKLKMTFRFPRFSIQKKFDAIDSDDYSLRNLADESNLEISYNKKFYLLGYILPYEREDGSKSWCEVGSSGEDIENWGQKFGIKHYLLFEMKFE
jgi:hypothetical protein